MRTYAALNFQYDTLVDNDGYYYSYDLTDTQYDFSIEHAFIELGGFRVGKTDSLFITFTGYAGGVINDDIIGYGPHGTNQIAYGWSNDSGLAIAVALEEGDGDIIAPFLPPDYFQPNLYTLDSYAPHVVAGIGWQGAWGGVGVVAGYDAVWDEGAVKARVDFYPTDRLALFAMAGLASYDSDFFYYPDYYYEQSRLSRLHRQGQPELLRALGRQLGGLGRRLVHADRQGHDQRSGLL